jgi:transposase
MHCVCGGEGVSAVGRIDPWSCLAAWVAELAERGLRVDYRTMWKFAHVQGLSFKKTVLASEQDRPDVARKRVR